MRASLHGAPFALTSDGDLLLGLAGFPAVTSLEQAVDAARREGGQVFVGVVVDAKGRERVLARLDDALTEAAALVLGSPERREQRRR